MPLISKTSCLMVSFCVFYVILGFVFLLGHTLGYTFTLFDEFVYLIDGQRGRLKVLDL